MHAFEALSADTLLDLALGVWSFLFLYFFVFAWRPSHGLAWFPFLLIPFWPWSLASGIFF